MERWHATASSDTSANHVGHLLHERFIHAPFPRRQWNISSNRLTDVTTIELYDADSGFDTHAIPRHFGMTDSCNQDHERNSDASSSDSDSISLLHDPNICQSRGSAEDMDISELASQDGNKEQKNKVQMKPLHPVTDPGSISCCNQSAAGGADSASLSEANAKEPRKIQLHKRNGKGETLLHRACRREDVARVKALIQAGISVNMDDYAGWTALHEACALGHEAVVEELLKAGANVNARSFNGVTPLHDAASSGHYQVVNLLLQYGSNPRDRNVGGLHALDMAEKDNIKELISTFQASSVVYEQTCEAPAKYTQAGGSEIFAVCFFTAAVVAVKLQLVSRQWAFTAQIFILSGDTSSDPHKQLSCQNSFSPSNSGTSNVQSRGSCDRARAPSAIQLRKKDTVTDNLIHSKDIREVLEEVGKKQTELWTWPLTESEDAGRYHAALKQIQSVLIEVLAKQHLEKDNLVHKFRSLSASLRQRVLKSQLISLASCQRDLVVILQKQMDLVEAYVTMKAKLSTQPPKYESSPNLFLPPASSKGPNSCNQDSQRKESHKAVTQTSLLRPAKDFIEPRPPTQGTKADVMNKKVSRGRRRRPQLGNTLQHGNFQMTGNNAMIESRAEDNSRHLPELIQKGLIPCGSVLQLLLKGQRHLAHVLEDGSIKDSKGKLHLAPEHWVKSIFGNYIPVSSTYAWDKIKHLNMSGSDRQLDPQSRPETDGCREAVYCRSKFGTQKAVSSDKGIKNCIREEVQEQVTFRDNPLSYYLLNMESDGNRPQTCPEEDVQHRSASSTQEALTTVSASLNHLMKIKRIHLVDDDELLPNAIMDSYWEKLLQKDCSESEDWGSDVL
ncbi:hypothetical protein PAMA_018871 [Pampus argenteus]